PSEPPGGAEPRGRTGAGEHASGAACPSRGSPRRAAMLLTITTTHRPATDLGYPLHKRPDRLQSFPLSFGPAPRFSPAPSPAPCTAALLLDADRAGLGRDRRGPAGEGGLLGQYVNDRPYVASSFLSVAIAQVFGSALAGRCKDRPELADAP